MQPLLSSLASSLLPVRFALEPDGASKSHPVAPSRPSPHAPRLRPALERFVAWFDGFGETSQDHQDFFASVPGRAAKRLYYKQPMIGKLAKKS